MSDGLAIRLFEPDDVHAIEMRSVDQWLEHEAVICQADEGMAWTFLRGDTVLAIMGVVQQWHGVANAWAIISNNARGHAHWLTRNTGRLIDAHAAQTETWRYHALVMASNKEYLRWVNALGYTKESRLIKGAPDKGDLIMYTKFYEVA